MNPISIPTLLIYAIAALIHAPSRAEIVTVQWERIYNGPQVDVPNALAADSAGNVIVTGSSKRLGYSDYYTAKYSAADGTLLWEQRYDGPGGLEDFPVALLIDNAGNAIVTGSSTPVPAPFPRLDYYTAKYAAADGALLWERRYNAANGPDEAKAMAVDNEGNVIVTGISSDQQVVPDGGWYTAKYAAADGTVLWGIRRTGGVSPSTLTMDSAGNVIVAGDIPSEIDDTNAELYAAKLSATTGALLWERRYNGPGNNTDSAMDVVVDNEGNAIICAASIGTAGDFDFYTVKYASADGALIWAQRYDGTGNSHDHPNAIEVDEMGNAIVCGSSTGTSSDFDLYTAKYAARDGALIWEKRYHGTGDGDDYAAGVEVDGRGNPVVFASSLGSNGSMEFYTAKYAADNGVLIWEQRNGPVSDNLDYTPTKRLALTPEGGAVVTGRRRSQESSMDILTVKYNPVDLDLDDDGLLDSWEVTHFGSADAHRALDDSDGDGAVELLELAFGTDPKLPASVPAPAVVMEGGYLTTTITKHPCVRYLVETGGTLEARFSAASTTVLTDTATTLKVRDNIPVGTQSTRFLRVKVTGAP